MNAKEGAELNRIYHKYHHIFFKKIDAGDYKYLDSLYSSLLVEFEEREGELYARTGHW